MINSFKVRQPVQFDIKNKEHRKHFYIFLTENRWSKDAPLFELEDSWVQVPDMLMRKFAVDTLIKEFGGEPIENR